MKYWEIIADNLKESRLEFGLRFNAGYERTNVLFRLGAILLFPFLFPSSAARLAARFAASR